jgi:uncharacterized OB-fold protein
VSNERLDESPATIYRDGLLSGRLRYQRCGSCGAAVFYPRVACPHCGGIHLDWADSEGLGTIYSTTTTRSRTGDRTIVLVDLDEGFRMMCAVVEDALRIGERVQAVMPQGTTAETLVFRRSAS